MRPWLGRTGPHSSHSGEQTNCMPPTRPEATYTNPVRRCRKVPLPDGGVDLSCSGGRCRSPYGGRPSHVSRRGPIVDDVINGAAVIALAVKYSWKCHPRLVNRFSRNCFPQAPPAQFSERASLSLSHGPCSLVEFGIDGDLNPRHATLQNNKTSLLLWKTGLTSVDHWISAPPTERNHCSVEAVGRSLSQYWHHAAVIVIRHSRDPRLAGR